MERFSLPKPPPIPPPGAAAPLEPETTPEEDGQVGMFRRRSYDSDMDMTPMVDVVFLLLIFFMITAAFGLQKSIEIPDPENDQSSRQSAMPEDREKTEENIVVHITKENRIFVEEEEAATQQELYARLRDHLHRDSVRGGRHVLVLAESEATHEHVVRVLDAVAGVGVDSVRLQTE